ncbi:MAG: M15 family metallopeptidase [Bacteroidota bacterium]
MLRLLCIGLMLGACSAPAPPPVAAQSGSLDSLATRYMEAYPEHIIGHEADSLIWADSSRMALDPDRDRAIQIGQITRRLEGYIGPLPARYLASEAGDVPFFLQLLLESYQSQEIDLPVPALTGPDATFPGEASDTNHLQQGDWVGLRTAHDSLPQYAFVHQVKPVRLLYHEYEQHRVISDSSWLPGQIAWMWRPVPFIPPGQEDKFADPRMYARLLAHASLKHQLMQVYPLDYVHLAPYYDPGRIRHEAFFRKMYGRTEDSVRSRLDTVIWLPGISNTPMYVTRVNGIADRVLAISDSLMRLPHLHKYLKKPAGAFVWRPIAGTDRQSMHSFGIALDINIKHAHYWRWDAPGKDMPNGYHNSIPLEIVQIFEAFGFIWGGKWYHYDTMHFEYRPELCPVRVHP